MVVKIADVPKKKSVKHHQPNKHKIVADLFVVNPPTKRGQLGSGIS